MKSVALQDEVRLFAPVSLERVDGQTGRIVFRVGPGM